MSRSPERAAPLAEKPRRASELPQSARSRIVELRVHDSVERLQRTCIAAAERASADQHERRAGLARRARGREPGDELVSDQQAGQGVGERVAR